MSRPSTVEAWRLEVSKSLGSISTAIDGIKTEIAALKQGQQDIISVADTDRFEDKEAQKKSVIRSWVAISLGLGSVFGIAFFHFGIDVAGFISVVGGVLGAVAKIRGAV